MSDEDEDEWVYHEMPPYTIDMAIKRMMFIACVRILRYSRSPKRGEFRPLHIYKGNCIAPFPFHCPFDFLCPAISEWKRNETAIMMGEPIMCKNQARMRVWGPFARMPIYRKDGVLMIRYLGVETKLGVPTFQLTKDRTAMEAPWVDVESKIIQTIREQGFECESAGEKLQI
jgi:hypothetical protein